ncbi:hypothetical protein [Parasphingorhabdus pacifica]
MFDLPPPLSAPGIDFAAGMINMWVRPGHFRTVGITGVGTLRDERLVRTRRASAAKIVTVGHACG